jgi:hypothetical protein
VYKEEVTGPEAPAARAALELTEITEAVVPPSEDTWKRLRKLALVAAVPELVIAIVKVRAVPATAVVGTGLPAVRSG